VEKERNFFGDKAMVPYYEAALALASKMPSWKPALQNGQKVACFFSLPIVFVE